jgi:hypothetical protein
VPLQREQGTICGGSGSAERMRIVPRPRQVGHWEGMGLLGCVDADRAACSRAGRVVNFRQCHGRPRQMVLRAFSLEASPEAVVESGTRAATIAEWFLHGSFRLGPVDVPRAQEGASKVADVMIMLICDRCSAVIASFSVAAVPVCSWCGNPRRAL